MELKEEKIMSKKQMLKDVLISIFIGVYVASCVFGIIYSFLVAVHPENMGFFLVSFFALLSLLFYVFTSRG